MAATTLVPKKTLLPTPALPQDLPGVELTDNARQVLLRRYVRHGDDGQPVESVEEMFWRVAYHIAKVEESYGNDVTARAREFYILLTSRKFFPNSPTFTGAGTPLGQLAACFVLPITDDMGRDPAGIFQSLRDAALIQQTGGGNGFSFARIRPKGSIVKSSAGQATGPVGFLRVYDHAFGEIAQGGTRRGANMGVLRVDHPDIEEFVTCKIDENQITNFNISVGVTDAFMQAVKDDADWDLVFPDVSAPEYRGFSGTPEQAVERGVPLKPLRPSKHGNYSKRSCNKLITTVNLVFYSWMQPTGVTRYHIYIPWKRPIRVANNGWDLTRIAAWARSTWLNIAVRMDRSIGKVYVKVL